MTICLGKSCSFGSLCVPFVNCCQFMYLIISLSVLRAGYGIWLYQFLIIAYLFILHVPDTILSGKLCLVHVKSHYPNTRSAKINWAASWQNQQNDCSPSKDSDQPRHPPSLISLRCALKHAYQSLESETPISTDFSAFFLWNVFI